MPAIVAANSAALDLAIHPWRARAREATTRQVIHRHRVEPRSSALRRSWSIIAEVAGVNDRSAGEARPTVSPTPSSSIGSAASLPRRSALVQSDVEDRLDHRAT
jgi:hypothetical protein